jgi:N-acetyl sugar amidotransferase
MNIFNRIIPILQIEESKLVKTTQFKKPHYLGNPLNVVSQFNELNVDEIVIHDIGASLGKNKINHELLEQISLEAQFPLAYRGGIQSVADARKIINLGFEKVVFNDLIFSEEDEIRSVIREFGSQAVVAALDVRIGPNMVEVFSKFGTKKQSLSLENVIMKVEGLNVGEILLTDIEKEGTRTGLNLSAFESINSLLSRPFIVCGGAHSHSEVESAVQSSRFSVAASSVFTMYSSKENILITYPDRLIKEAELKGYQAVSNRISLAAESFVRDNLDINGGCERCLISSNVPGAKLDSQRICYYCRFHDVLEAQYPTGDEGAQRLSALVNEMKTEGSSHAYDCIVGLSGGTDSSYLLHVLVKLGVRPLAVHFDNTWNTHTASMNIYNVVSELGVDLETYVVDSEEYDDIYKSFLLSGVKDVEAPTDIGFMGVLYRAAKKHKVKYIVEGHSFRTEGIAPLGWTYMDGKYIRDVHQKFGSVRLKTYPNMSLIQFIKWAAFSGIRRVRPLYWIDYDKEAAKQMLSQKYDWKWYGGHHLENRFTAFYFSYFLPFRWGIDYRQIEYSALIRSGFMNKQEALYALQNSRPSIHEILRYLKSRLDISDKSFEIMMSQPRKTFRDFRTYKRSFERLKPLFWVLLKLNRIPESFYIKYCKTQKPY